MFITFCQYCCRFSNHCSAYSCSKWAYYCDFYYYVEKWLFFIVMLWKPVYDELTHCDMHRRFTYNLLLFSGYRHFSYLVPFVVTRVLMGMDLLPCHQNHLHFYHASIITCTTIYSSAEVTRLCGQGTKSSNENERAAYIYAHMYMTCFMYEGGGLKFIHCVYNWHTSVQPHRQVNNCFDGGRHYKRLRKLQSALHSAREVLPQPAKQS